MKELTKEEIEAKAQSIIETAMDTDKLPSQDAMMQRKLYSVFHDVRSIDISNIILKIQTLNSVIFDKFKPALDSYRIEAEGWEQHEARKELAEYSKAIKASQAKGGKREAVNLGKNPLGSMKPAALKKPAEFTNNLAALLTSLEGKSAADKSVQLVVYRQEIRGEKSKILAETGSRDQAKRLEILDNAIKEVTGEIKKTLPQNAKAVSPKENVLPTVPASLRLNRK